MWFWSVNRLNNNFAISNVDFTKGPCYHSGFIIRYGNLYIGSFILKFEGLEANAYHNIVSDLPTVLKSAILLSVPNEYGSEGVCTINTNKGKNYIQAKCTQSSNYYYANFAWIA